MADYLTRVAEAVRDAADAACTKRYSISGAKWERFTAGKCAEHVRAIDLAAVIASVPRPEPAFYVKYREDDDSDWEVNASDHFSCGRTGGKPLYAEPVAALPAVPDGLLTAADMKHLRRFIECAEDMDAGGHDVSKEAMKRLEWAGAVRSLGFGRHETTAFGDAMLAAAPEAPQTIQCNACDWIGSSADARYLGGRAPLGPLCPECGETTGPADDAAALEAPQPVLDRPASIGGTTFGVGIPVRTLVAAAQRRYEVEQTPASLADRQALIDALRRPAVDAEIAALREQNAALVAALEHMVNDCESLEFDGAPSSAALNKAVYALASVKGGAA